MDAPHGSFAVVPFTFRDRKLAQRRLFLSSQTEKDLIMRYQLRQISLIRRYLPSFCSYRSYSGVPALSLDRRSRPIAIFE